MGLYRAPSGAIEEIPDSSSSTALASGYVPISSAQAGAPVVSSATGGALGAINAGATSLLSGATLGLSDVALKGLLNRGDASRLYSDREDNPIVSGAGQVIGAIAPSLLSGGSLAPSALVSRGVSPLIERGGIEALIGGGIEGSAQNVGAYLSDTALSDRDLSAEGISGALGGGFAFGSVGAGAAMGIEKGTIAARRMFSRLVDGGDEAATQAAQAWQTQYQATRDAHDAALDIAKAELAKARATREATGLGRDRASAGLAQIQALAPEIDAAHAAATGLDAKVAVIEAQEASRIASTPAGTYDDLHRLVGNHEAALSELDDVLRRIEAPELGPPEPVVPVGEFGAPGARGIKSPADLELASSEAASTADATRSGRPSAMAEGTPSDVLRGGSAKDYKIDLNSPIEKLSSGQLNELNSKIDELMPNAEIDEWDRLSKLKSEISSRQWYIEKGEIKDPVPYTGSERFTKLDRSAGGSHGGSWYRDNNGHQWFGKHYDGDTDRLWGEHVANEIYRTMGVSAPETEIVDIGGKNMLVSKEIPGFHAKHTSILKSTDVGNGFVVDAWLGNRDVIGASKDNIIISDGKAHRIDSGGATIWRAQGAQKTFVQKVSELESMRNPARQAGRVFGDVDIEKQLKEFSSTYNENKEKITDIVKKSGLSKEAKDRIIIGLNDRAAWLETEAMGKVPPLSDAEYKEFSASSKINLTPQELEDFHKYSGSLMFRDINSALREGKTLNVELSNQLSNLDNGILKSKSPRDMVVYRGVKGNRSLSAVDNLKPGDVYEDHGIGSTSRERNVAERFATPGMGTESGTGRPGVVMDISIPKGFSILPSPSNTYGKFETELLIPRGTRYIVTGVENGKNGIKVIKMAVSNEPSETLTGLLGGIQKNISAGESLSSIGASSPARGIKSPTAAPLSQRIDVVRVGRPSAGTMEARTADGTITPLSKGEVRAWADAQMPEGYASGLLETHRDFSIEHGVPNGPGDVVDNAIYIARPSQLAEHGINGNEIHPEHTAELSRPLHKKLSPLDVKVTPDGSFYLEDGNHRLQRAVRDDSPVALRFKKVSAEWEPQSGSRDISNRLRSTIEPSSSLTGLLRGTQEKLSAGESLQSIGAPARSNYVADKAARGQAFLERNAPMAKAEAAANRESAAHRVAQLEVAKDAAVERATIATNDIERATATSEAKAIDAQITKLGKMPNIIDDVASVSKAITAYEKSGTELTEGMGDLAPPMAKEHAAAFRAAEDTADRKLTDRATRAIDDHVDPQPVGRDRRPSANPPAKSKISEAKQSLREADAAYKAARVTESEAKIGVRQAKEARAAVPEPPVSALPKPSALGAILTTAGVAGELGIPGIPNPHDIPVVGPLLSAYLKYRVLKAAMGRFTGRVAATGDARAAALVAKTKQKVAIAIDRTLGLAAEAAPKARGAIVATTVALGRRVFDDGEPNHSTGATPQAQAAVRVREIMAANSHPELIQAQVRREMHGVMDPDLIDAAEKHLIGMFRHLASVAPKPPPDNDYAKRPWQPSQADTHELSQRLAVINDPVHALNGPMSPAAADTFRNVHPQLYELAKNRLISRVSELDEPMPRDARLRASALFQLPIDVSTDLSHVAIVRAPTKSEPQPSPMARVPNVSQMYSPDNTRVK